MSERKRGVRPTIAIVVCVTVLPGAAFGQTWSPDGGSLAFDAIRDRDRELYIIDITSEVVHHYSFNRAEDFRPVLSPNGTMLLFFRGRGHDAKLPREAHEFDIYMIDVRTKRETRLTRFHGYEGDPGWEPGGNGIVFCSNHLARDENFDIFTKHIDRGAVTRLTSNPASDFSPKYSPDGKKIVFVSRRDGHDQIYVMNADGSDQRRLIRSNNHEFHPDWSPSGRRIAFTSQRHVKLKPGQKPTYNANEMEIYIANADGTGVKRLTHEDGMDASPAFSPNGKRIVFSSQRDGAGVDAFYFMDPDGEGLSRLLFPPPPKPKQTPP